jgi:predicted kinase
MEIPIEGFPFSATVVAGWFRARRGRDPADAELNAILNAMAEREATPPLEGPRAHGIGEAAAAAPPNPETGKKWPG